MLTLLQLLYLARRKTSSPMRYLFFQPWLAGIIRCAAAAQQHRCCELHSVQSLYHARRKTSSPMGYLFLPGRGLPGIIRCAAAAQQRRCCELHSVQLLYPNYISFPWKIYSINWDSSFIIILQIQDIAQTDIRVYDALHGILSRYLGMYTPHTVGNSDCRSSPGYIKYCFPPRFFTADLLWSFSITADNLLMCDSPLLSMNFSGFCLI